MCRIHTKHGKSHVPILIADKPGACPKVELMLPENCDDDEKSSCSFDLECKGENEKCCADACGVKQCTQIGNVQRENDGYHKCYNGVIMRQIFVTGVWETYRGTRQCRRCAGALNSPLK